MEKNPQLEGLLARWVGEELPPYEALSDQPIRRYQNRLGEGYYLTGAGENPLHPTPCTGAALTVLEWERNRLTLTGGSAPEAAWLGILQAELWESLLHRAFPKVPFCLLGRVEEAGALVELRFWAKRVGPAPCPDFGSLTGPAFYREFI